MSVKKISSVIFFVALLVFIYLYFNGLSIYKCVEGDCVMSVYGGCKSKKDCLLGCNKSARDTKKVRFNLPNQDIIERSQEIIVE